MTPRPEETVVDGRRARRERNRLAVIDALFELLVQAERPPSVEEVAAHAGVSVSSVFRYFENLDDLQQETIERYFQRYAPHFEVPAVPAYVGLTRTIVTNLAASLPGIDDDRLDDLRIAVSEACTSAIDAHEPGDVSTIPSR